ncbi:MAG: isocitrate lyase/phosphoenolpyruvate mutase family protein [Chthoniobacterales bacterium]|nr:isocitrate lyase/phosphoenolpyruvate mutase family protein [Chthoniobacterales bacterium]
MTNHNSAQESAVARFRALHESGCFILPNPWDIGTARYLEQAGFEALATTSAGFAFSRGQADGAVPCDETLDHIREISQATTLPTNADFLNGFAGEPEGVAANVTRCVATGVAGLSIEDSTGDEDHPLFDPETAVARIKAARAAIDATGMPIVLTGRCEAFLVGSAEPMRTVLARLPAYAAAGAECLYAPGVSAPEEIAAIVRAVAPRPVNFLVSGFNSHFSVAQLADLGVRRISVGSGLALAAWGAFIRAADEMRAKGEFRGLAGGAPFAELNERFGRRA